MVKKHILVPIDFSNDSIRALDMAILIANRLSYDIRLIHVKRQNADYDASFNFQDFDEVLRSGVCDNFDRIIDTYQSSLHGEIDYKIREGRIYTEICNQAKYADTDLIVMGTHGVSGFEEHWVGSNAYRVVSNATCPVLTVRSNFPIRDIKTIVVPIDLSAESRQKVPFVTELAILFDAKLHMIDVRENNKGGIQKKLSDYMIQVEQYLNRRKVKYVRESLKGSNISDMCIEYALINDADLIAIMTELNDKKRILWMGQQAQQMVNHSPVPVMSFKPY